MAITNNDAFKVNFAKMLALAGNKAELAAKRVAIKLLNGVVMKSPVDQGRFRGNWQVSFNSPASVIDRDDKLPFGSLPGAAVAEAAQTALSGFKVGQTILLTNSLPYARAIEYGQYGKPPGSANGTKTAGGYSSQAPGGVVRLTVQNYAQELENEIKAMK